MGVELAIGVHDSKGRGQRLTGEMVIEHDDIRVPRRRERPM